MERFDAHVGAMQPALEQAPEVLHGVGMHVAIDVLNCMVDNGVLVVFAQAVIGQKFIGEDSRSDLHTFADGTLKFLFLSSLDMI